MLTLFVTFLTTVSTVGIASEPMGKFSGVQWVRSSQVLYCRIASNSELFAVSANGKGALWNWRDDTIERFRTIDFGIRIIPRAQYAFCAERRSFLTVTLGERDDDGRRVFDTSLISLHDHTRRRSSIDSNVSALAISKDGKRCAAGFKCGKIAVWDANDWPDHLEARIEMGGMICAIAFSEDGGVCAAADVDGNLLVLGSIEHKVLFEGRLSNYPAKFNLPRQLSDRIENIALSPDGRKLAVAAQKPMLVDLAVGKEIPGFWDDPIVEGDWVILPPATQDVAFDGEGCIWRISRHQIQRMKFNRGNCETLIRFETDRSRHRGITSFDVESEAERCCIGYFNGEVAVYNVRPKELELRSTYRFTDE